MTSSFSTYTIMLVFYWQVLKLSMIYTILLHYIQPSYSRDITFYERFNNNVIETRVRESFNSLLNWQIWTLQTSQQHNYNCGKTISCSQVIIVTKGFYCSRIAVRASYCFSSYSKNVSVHILIFSIFYIDH